MDGEGLAVVNGIHRFLKPLAIGYLVIPQYLYAFFIDLASQVNEVVHRLVVKSSKIVFAEIRHTKCEGVDLSTTTHVDVVVGYVLNPLRQRPGGDIRHVLVAQVVVEVEVKRNYFFVGFRIDGPKDYWVLGGDVVVVTLALVPDVEASR